MSGRDDDIDWEARAEELRQLFEEGIWKGVYGAVSVHPDDVLAHLRGRGLPAHDLLAVKALSVDALDPIAREMIRKARRRAAFGGASMGLAGWMGIAPSMGQLGLVLLRLAQGLSVVYGFDHRTPRGQIDLWKTLARGLGAESSAEDFEGTQEELTQRLPALVGRSTTFANPLAVRLAQAAASRLLATTPSHAARLVPVLGGGAGGLVHWRQVGRAGERIMEQYRARHLLGTVDLSAAQVAEVVSG